MAIFVIMIPFALLISFFTGLFYDGMFGNHKDEKDR